MYAFVVWLTGLALRLFYRRRVEGEAIPPDGPVVIVANHPNALVDPAMILQLTRRRVRFLAKEPLFRMPVLGRVVKAMGALPVYRAQDGHDTDKNAQMFAAVNAALARGEAICLFPEGISHNLPEVQPLKTGAARIALGAEAERGFQLGVRIVPVGFTYRDKRRYRSEQTTFIGEPILVGDLQDAWQEDERAAVVKLTENINVSIRALTVNMERWEDWPRFELAERIWADDGDERLHRIRRLAEAVRELRELAPAELLAVEGRIDALKERLDRLGMSPDDLEGRPSLLGVLRFVVTNLFALTVLLPVALAGLIAFFIPYLLAREIPSRMRLHVDEIASYRLLVAMVAFPIWLVLLGIALVEISGLARAAAYLVLLIPCGIYAQRFLRRRREAWADLRVFLTLGFSGPLRRRLEREKASIAADIERLERLLLHR